MIRMFALHLLFKKVLDDYDFLFMLNHMWEFDLKFKDEFTVYMTREKGIDFSYNFTGE